VAPRFLIDENLSPLLAHHLASVHGFDAVHVRDCGLLGAPDEDVLAQAIMENRVVVTSNGADFRKLGARTPGHSGLAILRDAVGRANQLTLGVMLANASYPETAADSRKMACGTALLKELLTLVRPLHWASVVTAWPLFRIIVMLCLQYATWGKATRAL
jgi:predicted nuclease of predicted toxin-antitoxin system